MKKFLAAIVVLVCIAIAYACTKGRDPGDEIALEIGESKITVKQLNRDIRFQSAELIDPNSQSVTLEGPILESVVNYYLIERYAKKHGVSVSKAELVRAIHEIQKDYPDNSFKETLLRRYVSMEQWKEALKGELLRKKVFDAVTRHTRPPSHIQIEQYYREHINNYKRPPRLRFRQIVTHSENKAREALSRIKKGESMAEVAKLYSYGPEAEKGGEVGWVEKGQLVPSMDKALFSLPVGKISSVVKSPYGYHIFQVMEIDPGGLQSLKEVGSSIQARLYSQARERAFQKWLEEQRARVKIKVLKKFLERTPRQNEQS
ncbi:MAG TPA: hypothetical protein ENG73_08185 [Desulfobacterales bacterium]|nr:hypothetical protein [Desulfobacterales bacterium]